MIFRTEIIRTVDTESCCIVLTSERRQFGAFLDRVNKSRLNIAYEILEKATDYFNDANKLGQGGSGSVYKVCIF